MSEEYFYNESEKVLDRDDVISYLISDINKRQNGIIVSKSGDGYISDIMIIYYLKDDDVRIDYSFADGASLEQRTFWSNFIEFISKIYFNHLSS